MANPFKHDYWPSCVALCPACAYERGLRYGVDLAKDLVRVGTSWAGDYDGLIWDDVDNKVEELCK